MPDLLVRLYELPALEPTFAAARSHGIDIRRGLPPEKHIVVDWVRAHGGAGWASECEVAFSHLPVSCFVAVWNGELIGFACYDATCKAFFGPTEVAESARGRGAGTALLLACLHDMVAQGYGYAIIGMAGPVDFYARVVGAVVIENSSPGVYRGMLTQ